VKLVTTSVYEKIIQAWFDKKRHIFIEGGTAASKTFSVMQFLVLVNMHTKSPLLTSIVSESVPHLKRGVQRDFRNILGDEFQDNKWNRTDSIYNFGKGSIEFFSADEPSKLRGGRRDILFINEINNIAHDSYRELDARTRLLTIADWNPVSEFFIYESGLLQSPDSVFIHATYKDALNILDPEVVKNILDMGKRDPNWAHVYLDGLLGKVEGLVYPYFEQIDAMPEGGQELYGLDFGYSNDPTVLTRNIIKGQELYSDQLIYESGLTNDAIAHRMIDLGINKRTAQITADSAEPKSIDEIHRYGFNVRPCFKGADSVEFGHQKIRQYKQYWTKTSLQCIKEQRNYRYIQDKDGKYTEKTTHEWSHGMDSRRYGVVSNHTPAEVRWI
jgi:phage terminase large subunit